MNAALDSAGFRVLVLSIVELDGPRAPKVGCATVARGLLDQWCVEWGDRAPLEVRVVANRIWDINRIRVRRLSSVVRGALTARASKIVFQETAEVLAAARKAQADGRWDLLVANGADMLGVARRLFKSSPHKPPLWVVVHNIEADIFREQLQTLPGWIRWVLGADLRRMEREEAAGFAAADRLICICEEDRERIRQLHPNLRAALVVAPIRFIGTPYCDRADPPTREPDAPLRLGMLGNFAWWPNRRGLDWFCKEVWPRLPENVELHLFGGWSIETAGKLGPRITGWGVCETLDEIWEQVDIMICPVRHGGGVRIKVAEAVWNGVPLITNRLGMRGVTDRPRALLIVRETAEDWVEPLRDLAARRNGLRVTG